jgi:FtsZ-binding cell division protein ZapB
VQVLTHLKEKLQFVQAENQLLKVELAELEAELSTHRDALTRAKHDRDALRSENLRLRGEAGLIGAAAVASPPPLPLAAPPRPFAHCSSAWSPLLGTSCVRSLRGNERGLGTGLR